MRLVVLCKGARVSEHFCADPNVLIGSGQDCQVCLPDPRIAAQHAALSQAEDGWKVRPWVENLPLLLNGVALSGSAPIRHGDRLAVHDYVILAYDDAAERTTGGMSVEMMTRFVKFQLPPGTQTRKGEEPITLTAPQLARLNKLSASLAACESVPSVMELMIQTLLAAFSAHRVWVGVRRVNYGAMEYVEGRLVTGQTCELPEIGENLKPRVLDRIQAVLVPFVSPEAPYSVMAGPLCGPDGGVGMAYLDTSEGNRRYDASDLDFLCALLGVIAAQMDSIFKQQARVRAATAEGEVIVAHAFQSRLTPRKLPQWEELQFGAFREPGRERSSDFYDVVKLSNQMAGVLICRTTATGPLPSMLMAQAHAAFRVCCMHLDAPHVFLRTMNYLLYDGVNDRPLDCFAGIIDPASGELRYAIAGNIGAYVIGNRGEERRIGGDGSTPALGLNKAAAHALQTAELDHSETLVLFTNGVVTAKNFKSEVFGEDRFVNILCDGFGQLASSMLKDMLTDLRNFTEGGSQPDDITVILAHRL